MRLFVPLRRISECFMETIDYPVAISTGEGHLEHKTLSEEVTITLPQNGDTFEFVLQEQEKIAYIGFKLSDGVLSVTVSYFWGLNSQFPEVSLELFEYKIDSNKIRSQCLY